VSATKEQRGPITIEEAVENLAELAEEATGGARTVELRPTGASEDVREAWADAYELALDVERGLFTFDEFLATLAVRSTGSGGDD